MTALRPLVLHLSGINSRGEDTGQLHHRVTNQAGIFADDPAIEVQALSWWHEDAIARACAASLLVLHPGPFAQFEGLLRSRRRLGRPGIYEIADDYVADTPWLKVPRRGQVHLQNHWYLAHLSDGVQFSSPGLERRHAILSDRRAVIPNAVAFPEATRPRPEGLRIGWAGTTSHRADLERIAPALAGFVSDHADVRLCLKGNPDMLADVFAGVPSERLEIEPFGDYDGYRRFLEGLHVGIAPLGPSSFNGGRSDIKLAEYAAAGAVPLAEDAPAYRPHAGIVPLFRDPSELRAHLERLRQDPAARAKAAQQAFTAFSAIRSPEAVRKVTKDWYRTFAPGAPGPIPASDPGALARQKSLQQALKMLRNGESAAARSICERLLADRPGYAQARFALVEAQARSGDTDAALETGLTLLDCVAHGDLYRTMRIRHRPDEADTLLAGFQSPWQALLATPRGRMPGPELLRRRLCANPWDWFALNFRIRETEPASAEAATLRARIALSTPEQDCRPAVGAGGLHDPAGMP
ncbi:MAG: tetratricopeptide repeat protein [Pseudomonadota bacterium]|nr:tetratricopeptide repeat protein [Pseudomonadota bacterium]